MTAQKSVTLQPTGDKLPLVGFGTARIPNQNTEQVVYDAIKTGNRLIDGALAYGNEAQVGRGVRRAIADGIVKHEDLFIPFAIEYVGPKEPLRLTNDMNELKLIKAPMQETWRELEALVDAGLIRNIGISNFNIQSTLDLLSYARIPPSVLQIEHHPYLQQRRLVKWIRSQNIQIMAYASFGNAVFEAVPPGTEHLENLMEHPVIVGIAEKHQISTGQILLAWAISNQVVVIPKTVNVNRMKSNLDINHIKLDDDDQQKIDNLEANARFNNFYVNNWGFDFPLYD